MSKPAKWIVFTLFIWILLAGAAAFGALEYLLPYREAENTMPASGTMILTQLADGTTQITWPQGVNAHRYLLEILRPAESENSGAAQLQPEVLHSAFVDSGTSYILPELPVDEELTIRVSSVRDYQFPFEGEARLRFGERSMEITGVFQPPAIRNLTWISDAEGNKVDVRFDLPENSTCRMYHVDADGKLTLISRLTEGWTTISFGGDEPFSMPTSDEQYTFAFDVCSEFDGYTYYGIPTEQFTVVREDMLGIKLNLNCVDEGNNVFSFTWNETKGDYYELQQYDAGTESWVTIHKVAQGGQRSYRTGHLSRYSDFRFRIIAVGGQTLPDSEFAAIPDEVQVSTGASLVYATVWPVQGLNVYSTPDRTEIIGSVPGARAYCILDAVDGMFRIRYEDSYGYIDSNYCMINLPEFIGDICLYDITNSYDSLCMAHEYELPAVTGKMIVGYERVRTADDDFLVPLLYPTALKLEKAAFSALEQGYKLKIYDAFRPRQATQALHDQAIKLSAEPIPEVTYSGEPVDEGEVLTYEMLMTDQGRYTINDFLAASGSRHNQGLAMDLTIVRMWDGGELEMQTAIHDLSWYSERKRNNSNADILSGIMLDAGFVGMDSEWWHFQDDHAKKELSPDYLWNGVTPQCWMADDNGWRYRGANGRYYTDCTRIINGMEYTFDKNGYVKASG